MPTIIAITALLIATIIALIILNYLSRTIQETPPTDTKDLEKEGKKLVKPNCRKRHSTPNKDHVCEDIEKILSIEESNDNISARRQQHDNEPTIYFTQRENALLRVEFLLGTQKPQYCRSGRDIEIGNIEIGDIK